MADAPAGSSSNLTNEGPHVSTTMAAFDLLFQDRQFIVISSETFFHVIDTLLFSAQAWKESEHHFYAAVSLVLTTFGLTVRFAANDVALGSHPQPKIIPDTSAGSLTIPDFGLFMTFLQDAAVEQTSPMYKSLSPCSLWEVKRLYILNWFPVTAEGANLISVAFMEEFRKSVRQISIQALESFRHFPVGRELRVWLLVGIGYCVLKYKRPPLDHAQNLPSTKGTQSMDVSSKAIRAEEGSSATTQPAQVSTESILLAGDYSKTPPSQPPQTPVPSRKQPNRSVKPRKPAKRKRHAHDDGDENEELSQDSDEEIHQIPVGDWAAYLEPPEVEYFNEIIFRREAGKLSFNPLFCQAMREMLEGQSVVVQPSFFNVPENHQPTRKPGSLKLGMDIIEEIWDAELHPNVAPHMPGIELVDSAQDPAFQPQSGTLSDGSSPQRGGSKGPRFVNIAQEPESPSRPPRGN